jgi:probable rRNA maturation factor
LARETVIQEANAENKSLTDHLSHLIVHGCLHLLGYDHLMNDDAEQMEALEIQLLARIGITNPYQEMIDPLATAPGRQKNP